MSKTSSYGELLPPAYQVLIPIAEAVDLAGVDMKLIQFAARLAYVHFLLFDLPLQVTGAAGATVCYIPSHAAGRALDVQMNDLSESEQDVFRAVTEWLAAHHNVVPGLLPVKDGFLSMHLELKP